MAGRGGRGALLKLEMEQTESMGHMESKTGSHMSENAHLQKLLDSLLEEKEIERQEYQHLRKGSLEERIESGLSWPLVKLRTVREVYRGYILHIEQNLKIDVARWNWRGRYGHPSSHKYI